MQLFVRLKEDIGEPKKEVDRMLLWRDPKELFEVDEESREDWDQISNKCDVNEKKYIEIPLIDLSGTRTEEFQCMLENVKAPLLSYFIQEMIKVGSNVELNLD